MKLAVGSDHRGFANKSELVAALKKSGHEVTDVGTYAAEPPCDYPEIALKVGREVSSRRAEKGILVCKSGIGMSIAANKVRGVRAALVQDLESALLSRRHNDANVLVLGSEKFEGPLGPAVEAWLREPFEGGRHERRVSQITKIEKETL